MNRDRVIRVALWMSVGLNLLGVAVFLPAALGSSGSLLPVPAPRFYAGQVGLTIALFCGVYAWLCAPSDDAVKLTEARIQSPSNPTR